MEDITAFICNIARTLNDTFACDPLPEIPLSKKVGTKQTWEEIIEDVRVQICNGIHSFYEGSCMPI